MTWWAWLVLGLLLLGGEMLTPGGFFLLFFGIGALAVGLLQLGGMGGPSWLQWLLFSVISVATLAGLRPRLMGRLARRAGGAEEGVTGEVAVIEAPLAPGATGRAELRGTVWSARNLGPEALAAGDRARVERVEDLVLLVRKEA